jgi:predicted PurR-regulated permease PerM
VAAIILVLALGAVSEIVLRLTFAAVLAVIFKPVVGTLRRRSLKPTLAAGVVVLGLLALMTGVVAATVQGVTQQTDEPLVFTIMVVNFIGGYIPYIGALLGGGLAVVVALGDDGPGKAAVMLLAVLASNLVLENFVEPKVIGRSLDVHPLAVLVVTALGGVIKGIVGLILAVPFFVMARSGIARLRRGGFFGQMTDRAQPALQRMLD